MVDFHQARAFTTECLDNIGLSISDAQFKKTFEKFDVNGHGTLNKAGVHELVAEVIKLPHGT